MGAAESRAHVTPSRPIQNRHLSRVTDPRSPTAGITRTPIEVGDTPKRTFASVQDEEEVLEASVIADPRSPTHGIVRTPLRPTLHDSLNLLAKQLSEVFVSEDSEIEGSPAVDVKLPAGIEGSPATDVEPPAGIEGSPAVDVKLPAGIEGSPAVDVELPAVFPEEQAESDPTSTPALIVKEAEETALESPGIQAAAPAEPTPPALQPQKQRGKSPHGSGSKNIRQRPRKALMSAAPGRSPLKILQEDNSPNTAGQNRPLKKISFQSEPPSSLRNLKISHSSWEMSHNKENAHYRQSES